MTLLQIVLRVILIGLHFFFSTRRNALDVLIPKVRTESAKIGTFYTGA